MEGLPVHPHVVAEKLEVYLHCKGPLLGVWGVNPRTPTPEPQGREEESAECLAVSPWDSVPGERRSP